MRVAGFCCQAPAGLRLGRVGESNQIVIVVISDVCGLATAPLANRI